MSTPEIHPSGLASPLCQTEAFLRWGPRPPGIAAVAGTVQHRVAEPAYRRRIAGEAYPSIEEVGDLARDAVTRCLDAEEPRLVEDDADDWGGSTVAAIRPRLVDRSIAAARVQRAELWPNVEPRLVEYKIALDLGECTLVGTLDLVDAWGRVRDLKTRKGRPAPEKYGLQTACYSLLYESEVGSSPSGIVLDWLCRASTKKAGETWGYEATASPPFDRDDLQRVLDRVILRARMISAGLFPPPAPGDWMCAGKWCGWHPEAGGPCTWPLRGATVGGGL